MKRQIAALFIPFLLNSVLAAEPTRWYAAVSLGPNIPSRVPQDAKDSSSVPFSPTAIGTSVFQMPDVLWQNKFGVGASSSIAIGRSWSNHLRVEGEFVYQYMTRYAGGSYHWQERYPDGRVFLNDDHPNTLPQSITAANVFSLMGDVLYDFQNDSRIKPFAGAGIGVAWLNSPGSTNAGVLNVTSVNPFVQTSTPMQATSPGIDGAAFAWQIKLGLNYVVREGLNWFLLYRLFGTSATPLGKSVITTNPGTPDSTNFIVGKQRMSGIVNNSVELGLAYYF